MTSKLLYQILCVFITIQSTPAFQLECPLEWRYQEEKEPFPSDAVAASNGTYYVARVYIPSIDSWRVGSAEITTGRAYIHDSEYVAYELLTNPHDCILEWVNGKGIYGHWTPLLSVPTGDYGNTPRQEYVGRALVNVAYVAGTARTTVGRIELGDRTTMKLFQKVQSSGEQFPSHLKSYQILRSYQPGLEETIIDMEIDAGTTADTDFDYIGMDEIQNDSDGEISQTVAHSTRFRQMFSLTHTGSKIFNASNVRHLVNAKNLKIDLNGTHYLAWSDGLTFESWSEKELAVSRQITVPARTSVQACSTVKVLTQLDSSFTGTSVFRGRGMSGGEVYHLLKDIDPDVEAEIVGDTVHVPVTGTVTAKSAISIRFIVLPADTMENCELVRQTAQSNAEVRGKKIADHLKKLRRKGQEVLETQGEPLPEAMTYKKQRAKHVVKFVGVKAKSKGGRLVVKPQAISL